MMTPKLLQQVGTELFGPRWQSALARYVGKAPRTVRRWVAGDVPVPDWAERQLLQLQAGVRSEAVMRHHRHLAQRARQIAQQLPTMAGGAAWVEPIAQLLRDLAHALASDVESAACDSSSPSQPPPSPRPARRRRRPLST